MASKIATAGGSVHFLRRVLIEAVWLKNESDILAVADDTPWVVSVLMLLVEQQEDPAASET